MMDLIFKDVEECIGNLFRRELEMELILIVIGKIVFEEDFIIGKYRFRNV